MILRANESGVGVDIVVPRATETLADTMDEYKLYGPQRSFVDRSIRQLYSKYMVCATSRKRFMNYETVYFVEIVVSAIELKSFIMGNDLSPQIFNA